MKNADSKNTRELANGRKAYWDDKTGTIVIHDPNSKDLGTVFRSNNGKEYFLDNKTLK